MGRIAGAVVVGVLATVGAGAGRARAAEPVAGAELEALLGRGQERVWVALLRPLNVAANGGPVRGIAVVRVEGDRVDVTTVAGGLHPGVPHMQHIHGLLSGAVAACPPSAADADGNGVVDVVEGVPFYGPILVPLDADLADLGAQAFPTASAGGTIRYAQQASLAALEKALGAPLEPEKRVIALHGVAPDAALPPGTQALPGLTPAQALPVACGELVRVR